MSEPVNPMVIDLSHWDPAYDYDAVRESGIVGVIYKATEGSSYNDPTYVEQQQMAKTTGLLWGAYHFANGEDVGSQVRNFMEFACPDPDELFVLDWEDNPDSTKMSVAQAKEWITQVENKLGRPGECVIYGGNTLKEMIDGEDPFFGSRRLWLCQYGSTPSLPESWSSYWLWQYTDGVYGPSPHTIDGVGPCDINSFDGTEDELRSSWAIQGPTPQPRPEKIVGIDLSVPPGVGVSVSINGSEVYASSVRTPASRDVRRKRGEINVGDTKERWGRIRQNRYRKEAAPDEEEE